MTISVSKGNPWGWPAPPCGLAASGQCIRGQGWYANGRTIGADAVVFNARCAEQLRKTEAGSGNRARLSLHCQCGLRLTTGHHIPGAILDP